MFDKLFKYLATKGITEHDLICYEPEGDMKGTLSAFIPWRLARKVVVADIAKLLPVGWTAKDSKRDIDVAQSIAEKVEYTPSIAIQKGQDAKAFLNNNA
jgi:hypothetical protein